MDYMEAIALGAVQGMAEWLPISSQAMVSLMARFLLDMEYKEAVGTAIFLHGGTLLSATVYLRNELIGAIRSAFGRGGSRSLLIFLVISTLMTGLVGAPLLMLALTVEVPDGIFTAMIGIFLICMALLQRMRRSGSGSKEPDALDALICGAAQGLAALPGVSRSGITLAALLGRGHMLKDSLRMSFLMSIPAVSGAELLLPIIKGPVQVTGPLIAGLISAAITGFLTMGLLIQVASRPDFHKVTAALGVLVLLFAILIS